MAGAGLVLGPVMAALLALGLWWVVRRATRSTEVVPLAVDGLAPDELEAVLRAHRGEARRMSLALGAGLAAAALTCTAGVLWPQLVGLPYALAPGVGALAGLLVLGLLPQPTWPDDPDSVRTAELVPRRATSFARQWVFVLPAVSAAALLVGLVGLVVTGVLSSPDELGRYRVFQRRGIVGWTVEEGRLGELQQGLSSSSPFPGWYYGVPVMVLTVLLLAVVHQTLGRTARQARPVTTELFGADTRLRGLRTRFVMAASSAALGAQVAGLLVVTGTVLRAAHLDVVPTADVDMVPDSVPVEPGHTLGLVLVLCGLVVAGVAVVLLATALLTTARSWDSSRPAGDRTSAGVAR